MTPQRIEELIAVHRDGLLKDTIPFWLKHGLDHEHGGLRNFLDSDGSVYNDDKAVWQTGRFGWITATLYNEVEQREDWLNASRSCAQFLLDHCFDTDGRLFFEVTRDGRPLRKRRYIDTENFAIMALSEYGKAAKDGKAITRAEKLFELAVDYFNHPEKLPSKYNPDVFAAKGHGNAMGTLSVAQQLRRVTNHPLIEPTIDNIISQVRSDFMHPQEYALFETVALDGSRLPGPVGRCVNPGHAIETAWFLMREGEYRSDQSLIQTGCTILDWSLQLGWDKTHGGILYFIDIEGKPLEQYEHEMKLAWPHNEALVACLYAYWLTHDRKYEQWYERVHEWSYAHFPDAKNGDWFKYLNRDGQINSSRKGSHWVSVFHLPRQQFVCWQLLEKLKAETVK